MTKRFESIVRSGTQVAKGTKADRCQWQMKGGGVSVSKGEFAR